MLWQCTVCYGGVLCDMAVHCKLCCYGVALCVMAV